MDAPWHWQGDDLILALRIQPRASRDAWMGIHGTQLRLRITAPPVDGAANEYLQRFLAKQFSVPLNRVALLSGQQGRNKRFRVESPQQLPDFIAQPDS